MRVIVPALPERLHPTVIPSILRSGYRAEVVGMVGAEAYFELFCELWASGDSFALIEHDIQVRPGVLRHFATCPAGWCAHSYEVFAGDIAASYGGPWGLGCVRFRAELCASIPELPAQVGADSDTHWAPKHWATLDATVTKWLKGAHGLVVCHHAPPVNHHHRYQRPA